MPGTMATSSPTPSASWSEWGPVFTGEGSRGVGAVPTNSYNRYQYQLGVSWARYWL